MVANGWQMGAGWLFWMAWVAPPVIVFALMAGVVRWLRPRGNAEASLAQIDPRRLRFEQATARPRKRRLAMLDAPVDRHLSTNLLQSLEAAAARRPGLTNRWKGDHRIAIHRS